MYLRLKLLKNKENNKLIVYPNLKNIPCYVTSEISLKRFYFVLPDDGLSSRTTDFASTLHLSDHPRYTAGRSSTLKGHHFHAISRSHTQIHKGIIFTFMKLLTFYLQCTTHIALLVTVNLAKVKLAEV